MLTEVKNNICQIFGNSLTEEELSGLSCISMDAWGTIYKFSRVNNLIPLLYHKIKTYDIKIPVEIEQLLRDSYMAFSAKDLKRKQQLHELIKILNEHKIDCIFLKGTHIAEKMYANSALRPMCDIDLLVHPEDVDRAFELLISNGYSTAVKQYADLKDAFNFHYPPLFKLGGLSVELHIELSRIYNFNLANIWKRSRICQINGQQTRIMSTEDLLLYTCYHKVCEDNFQSGFRGLCDVDQIVSHCGINWQQLGKMICKNDWENPKPVFLCLFFAEKFLGTEVDKNFLASIKPKSFTNKYEKVAGEILFFQTDNFRQQTVTQSQFFYDSLKNFTLKPLLKGLFFSPEKMAYTYNVELSVAKLLRLYAKRIFTKIQEVFIAVFKNIFSKKDEDVKKLIFLGKQTSILKNWLND